MVTVMVTKAKAQEVPQVEVKSREYSQATDLDKSLLDPNFEYRWVNKSPLKVARKRTMGYRIVDPATEEILNILGDAPEAADGTYTIGDVVLMKIPKLEHRARRVASKQKTDKRLKGPVRKFKKAALEKGSQRGEQIEVITRKDPEKED
jgi:hypothetical protein